MKNTISFCVRGRHALFTDPITKIGGEKCSYHIPTYEAIIGVLKSIYWKPTLIWKIDKIRVINKIRTQAKGMKPLEWSGGNSLAIYTYLHDIEYQIEAHFEWNLHRPELAADRIEGKHYAIAKRMLEKGGRQDVFLGTRECQSYVEPCPFGEGPGAYDELDELGFGLMFHGFDYPDETGISELQARFWYPTMHKGVIAFTPPEHFDGRDPRCIKRFIRPMEAKLFGLEVSLKRVLDEEQAL